MRRPGHLKPQLPTGSAPDGAGDVCDITCPTPTGNASLPTPIPLLYQVEQFLAGVDVELFVHVADVGLGRAVGHT